MTIKEQLNFAARHRKKSKLALIGELLESDRLLREDAKQIFRLGEENKQLREALAMRPNGQGEPPPNCGSQQPKTL